MKNSLEVLAATSPKLAFRTYRETAAKIKTLESALGLPPGKPILHILRANERVAELEAMAARVAAPLPASSAVAPTAVAAPSLSALTGRDRFLASCAADAAAKPKSQSHPELRGRERFSADVRVDSAGQILSAAGTPETAGAKSEKTGRARFVAAVKKSN